MELKVKLVLEPGDELTTKLESIAQMCDAILTKMEAVMAAFDDLKVASAAEANSIAQVSAYVQSLITKLQSATSPEDIAAITAELVQHKAALDAMVPAAPAPAPEPAPAPAPEPAPAPAPDPTPAPAPEPAPAPAPAPDAGGDPNPPTQ